MSRDSRSRQAMVSGGVAWFTRMVQAALSLGAAVVLARLLTPDAFGVFAMVVPLGVVANQLAGQAFQTVLLQRPALTDDETHGFFWFAARTNLLIAATMVATGSVLAAFYREPRVLGVTVAWAVMTWLLTATTFQEALLKRALRFPVVMLAQFAGLVVGIAVAVLSARRGVGYWALPIQLLVMEAVRAVGVAAASRWVPQLQHAGGVEGAAALRGAWRALVGHTVARWLGEQPELMAVGRVGGAHALGLYDTGRRWAWYPFEESYTILGDVTVAGARVAGADDAVRRFLSQSILATLTVSLPAIAFAGVTAPVLVPVLLGDQWLEAIPFLRLLCVAAFMGALSRVAFWIPLARGAPAVLLRWSALIQLPATLSAVLVGIQWGPLGVARAMAVSSALLVLPSFLVMTRSGPLTVGDLARVAGAPVIASVAAALGVGLYQPDTPSLPHLLMQAGVFASVFVSAWLLLPGGAARVSSLVRNVRTLFHPNGRTSSTAPSDRTHE